MERYITVQPTSDESGRSFEASIWPPLDELSKKRLGYALREHRPNDNEDDVPLAVQAQVAPYDTSTDSIFTLHSGLPDMTLHDIGMRVCAIINPTGLDKIFINDVPVERS